MRAFFCISCLSPTRLRAIIAKWNDLHQELSMAIDHQRLDRIVLAARQAAEAREKGYRERALCAGVYAG